MLFDTPWNHTVVLQGHTPWKCHLMFSSMEVENHLFVSKGPHSAAAPANGLCPDLGRCAIRNDIRGLAPESPLRVDDLPDDGCSFCFSAKRSWLKSPVAQLSVHPIRSS